MAEYTVSVSAKNGTVRYVFDDMQKARDLLDLMLDTCENTDGVIHSIYESPFDAKERS